MKNKRFIAITAVIGLLLIGLELTLRLIGLNTPLLYEKTAYGYRVTPSQDIRRLGGHMIYNNDGFRNNDLPKSPGTEYIKIIAIGDSITFGGATISNEATYPGQLNTLLNNKNKKNIVLNASAAGWSIANELGWLKEHGIYNSDFAIIQIGENDIFQEITKSEIIDTHPAFPSHRPTFAIENLLSRYIIPKILRENLSDPGVNKSKTSKNTPIENIKTLQEIVNEFKKNGAIPIILFIDEEQENSQDEVYKKDKQLFIEKTKEITPNFIRPFYEIEAPKRSIYFKDRVHPNEQGNVIIAKSIMEKIESIGKQ